MEVKFSGVPSTPVNAGMTGNGSTSDDATAGKVCMPFNALDVAMALGEFSGVATCCAVTCRGAFPVWMIVNSFLTFRTFRHILIWVTIQG